jgi:hypothetical protein
MTAPKRVHMTRSQPWRRDNPDAVIVDRRSKWGNPYRWTDYPPYPSAGWGDDDPRRVPDSTRRRHAVTDFEAALLYSGSTPPASYPSIEEIRAELAGKDLACWCPLSEPCHADVLLKVANQPVEAVAA